MPDPADRQLPGNAMMPKYVQDQLKQTLQTSGLAAPVFTSLSVPPKSGTDPGEIILSGTNARGRTGFFLQPKWATVAEKLLVGASSGVDVTENNGYQIWGLGTVGGQHFQGVWFPVASGVNLFGVHSGGSTTLTFTIVEY